MTHQHLKSPPGVLSCSSIVHCRSPWDVRIAFVAAQVGRFTAAWVCVGPAFLLADLFLSYADFASFAQGLSDLVVYQIPLPHFPVQIFFHVYVWMCMLVATILYPPPPTAISSVQVSDTGKQ